MMGAKITNPVLSRILFLGEMWTRFGKTEDDVDAMSPQEYDDYLVILQTMANKHNADMAKLPKR